MVDTISELTVGERLAGPLIMVIIFIFEPLNSVSKRFRFMTVIEWLSEVGLVIIST